MRKLFILPVIALLGLGACTDPYGRIDPLQTGLLGAGIGAAAGLGIALASQPRRPNFGYGGGHRGFGGGHGGGFGGGHGGGFGGGFGRSSPRFYQPSYGFHQPRGNWGHGGWGQHGGWHRRGW